MYLRPPGSNMYNQKENWSFTCWVMLCWSWGVFLTYDITILGYNIALRKKKTQMNVNFFLFHSFLSIGSQTLARNIFSRSMNYKILRTWPKNWNYRYWYIFWICCHSNYYFFFQREKKIHPFCYHKWAALPYMVKYRY